MVLNAQTALNYLSAATPNIEEVRAGLSSIMSDGLRAADIVKSTGAMFRHEAQEKTRVDIDQLILSVLALARIDLQDHAIVLDTELVTQNPTVEGNAVQLQQVIFNLIMNAVQAMQSVQPRVLRIKSERRQPDLVRVSIEDTGTAFSRPTCGVFLIRFSRPKHREWEWALPFANRSSRTTRVGFGYPQGRAEVRFSSLNCRQPTRTRLPQLSHYRAARHLRH